MTSINPGTDAHNPASADVPDLRVELDRQLAACPVAHAGETYTVLGHREVTQAATDAEVFSSAVSRHRAIPNSLDGEDHAAYRAIVDRYMTSERVAAEEHQCRAHADAIVASLDRGSMVRVIGQFGIPYAVRTQLQWLGWPADLEEELVAWMADNRAATRSGEYARTAEVAARFDAMIERLLEARDGTGEDVTSQLMRETVDGRPLTRAEIVSILRNWTAGDLGSLATSLGVLVQHLATHQDVQADLRQLVAAEDTDGIDAAILEILRIDDPFVANRRVTTRQTELGGVTIPAGARVVLNWTAANRDPEVFGDPDAFAPAANRENNLVFGIGPHVCPGMELSLMELRVAVVALLAGTAGVTPSPAEDPVRLEAPGSGWSQVPVVLA